MIDSRFPAADARHEGPWEGVRGRLITATFARSMLPLLPGAGAPPHSVCRDLERWWEHCEASLGPASSARAIADVAAVPLLRMLGFSIASRSDDANACLIQASAAGRPAAIVLITLWNEPLDRTWRAAVRGAIAGTAGWCLCCNGRALRIVDARRTWSRDYLEVDLPSIARRADVRSLLWTVGRAEAMASEPPLLDVAVAQSLRHGVEVCRALGSGVLQALAALLAALAARRRQRTDPRIVFEHSLTVLYRVLFLLFAEARGLVPVWHPVYRDRYSIEVIATTLLEGRRYRGLWQAIHAISRLAHSGCSVGELEVAAFNGRLFSPAEARLFERARIGDAVMEEAILSVASTSMGRGGRTRITYRDLDVEQLGAIYEQVLEYEPVAPTAAERIATSSGKTVGRHAPRAQRSEPGAQSPEPRAHSVAPSGGHATSGTAPILVRTRDVRKSTGAFYTPRTVTACLVRHTLAPLVDDRSSAEILQLRVLDPAMGSGAFLVAACRYLAQAVEDARIREGVWHSADVAPSDRAQLRREVAARCLFGVDLNPMAVQLARLSLWLATLAADKPLSFLDHHLVAGDSLVGATADDMRRQPGKGRSRRRQTESGPLFDEEHLDATLAHAVRTRLLLEAEADDSAAAVHGKEQALLRLQSRGSELGRWARVLDLWCAGWFWQEGQPPDRGTFAELQDHVLGRPGTVSRRLIDPLLAHVDALAARYRFLHWPLTFPEAFTDDRGLPRVDPGFDAILGNPPWEMVRGDTGSADTRQARRIDARRLTSFVRESGIYRAGSGAHVNSYQLFLERALQLTRQGGRIGLVLPSGFATDAGSAALRRHLFERADVDSLTGLDNRSAIFPVHRSVRFTLLTCTRGHPTRAVRCRFGITRLEDLEAADAEARRAPILVTRSLLSRLSGEDDLGIPELASAADLRIVEKISAAVPWLASEGGWGVRFGRELNATDDRDALVPIGTGGGRRVVEGKQLDPFRVLLDRCQLRVAADADDRIRVPRRARLAYRDVASATNRLTLIAAIVPADVVTTHTVFCSRGRLPVDDLHMLCALLNSFVANYLVRMRVNTHVTASLMSRLPVPVRASTHPVRARLAALSRALAAGRRAAQEMPEYAELQALVAHLYGLATDEFSHVLSTFPLIDADVKARALKRFVELT